MQYFPGNLSNISKDKNIYSTIVPKNGGFVGLIDKSIRTALIDIWRNQFQKGNLNNKIQKKKTQESQES